MSEVLPYSAKNSEGALKLRLELVPSSAMLEYICTLRLLRQSTSSHASTYSAKNSKGAAKFIDYFIKNVLKNYI